MATIIPQNISIDSEFKTLIPALQPDEYQQLEMSIVADGCRDAIVIWKGKSIIVDGHNRHEICKKHNIEYRVIEREFETRDDVIVWMINNQFSRRNISAFVRAELALKLKSVFEKQARENQKTSTGGNTPQLLSNLTKAEKVNTRKELSKISEVSEGNIRKVEKITQRTTPKIIQEKARRGDLSINRADKLTRALERSPLGFIDKIIDLSDDNEEKVLILNRLHKSMGSPETNGTFQEIMDTGGFAYGDEMDKRCEFKTATVEMIQKGLQSIALHHAKMHANEKRVNSILAIGSSLSNEWYTPQKYIESARAVLGDFDVDPASSDIAQQTINANKHYTLATNGLDKEWHGRIWLNPPYGNECSLFIEKLMIEVQAERTNEAIVLVNSHATDTKWFQPLWDYTLCFTNHRINFISPNKDNQSGSNHGSVFIYIGNNIDVFTQEFEQYGVIVRRYLPKAIARVA